jgi:hypothetical protein
VSVGRYQRRLTTLASVKKTSTLGRAAVEERERSTHWAGHCLFASMQRPADFNREIARSIQRDGPATHCSRPPLPKAISRPASRYELLPLCHELASIRNQFMTPLARDVPQLLPNTPD